MVDGTEKEIRQIQRGDLVFGDNNGTINQVAQLSKVYIGPDVKLRMVKINKDSLGQNQPNKELTMTASHPILWNGERKRSKCFREIDGVEYLPYVRAKDILPVDADGHYALYDLVFEDNAYYIANGLTIQSHSPECFIGALPEEAYFNKDKIGHVCNYPHPMKNTLVKKSIIA